MSKKQLIMVIALAASLSFSACSRASSPPPTPTPTGGDSVIQVILEQATLTEQAAAGNAVIPTNPGNNVQSTTATPTSTWPLVTATPTPTTEIVQVDPQTVPASYTLHEGEFPYCLARRFNINVDTLMSANGLVGNSYQVGQTLTIPQGAGPYVGVRALSPHPAQYTVVSSDTFYSIACKFGDVYPESIAQANGMGIDAVLTVGQTLQIP